MINKNSYIKFMFLFICFVIVLNLAMETFVFNNKDKTKINNSNQITQVKENNIQVNAVEKENSDLSDVMFIRLNLKLLEQETSKIIITQKKIDILENDFVKVKKIVDSLDNNNNFNNERKLEILNKLEMLLSIIKENHMKYNKVLEYIKNNEILKAVQLVDLNSEEELILKMYEEKKETIRLFFNKDFYLEPGKLTEILKNDIIKLNKQMCIREEDKITVDNIVMMLEKNLHDKSLISSSKNNKNWLLKKKEKEIEIDNSKKEIMKTFYDLQSKTNNIFKKNLSFFKYNEKVYNFFV